MAGRPPSEKTFANMLRVAISEAHEAGGTMLRAVAQALVDKALTGDVPAIREVADRLDGKSVQQLDVAVTTKAAATMSDDELAAIASGSGQSAASQTVDPSRLN